MSPKIIIPVVILSTFTTLIFILRIYSKVFVTHSLGWDDYTCVLGVIGTVSYGGIYSHMLHYGDGRYIQDITHGQYQDSFKYLFVTTLFSGPTIFLVKVSILILYHRIFALDRRMRILIYLGVGYTLLGNIIATILFGTLCTPRKGETLGESFQSSTCAENVHKIRQGSGTLNLVGDIYILILPVPSILKLQLPKKRKLSLLVIFMTGFIACIASLVSLLFRVKYNLGQNRIYWDPRIGFTIIIEMNMGILCASMPACTAIFNRFHSTRTDAPPPRKLKSWLARSSIDSVSRKTLVEKKTPSRGSSVGGFHSHPEEDSLEQNLCPEGEESVAKPVHTYSMA